MSHDRLLIVHTHTHTRVGVKCLTATHSQEQCWVLVACELASRVHNR